MLEIFLTFSEEFGVFEAHFLIKIFIVKKTCIFPSHSNQLSSLPLELIDWFLYKEKIGFKLIKIPLCEAKMSVLRAGSRASATSKTETFVTIVKEWKLSKIVTNSSILDVTVALDPV